MAGYTLMTAVALSAMVPWGFRPTGPSVPGDLISLFRPAPEELPAPAPPLVSLSIEPVAPGPSAKAEAKAPVVFPGYLLPADTLEEEGAHAGR